MLEAEYGDGQIWATSLHRFSVFGPPAAPLTLLLLCILEGGRGLGESYDASPDFMQDSLKISPDSGRDITLRKIHKEEMKTLAG